MLPAQQCLHPDNLFGLQLHLRLIDQIELIALQRPAQIILQLQTFFSLHLHGGDIAPDLHILFLGVMHSRIRILNQLLCSISVAGVNTHPEA
ncbi:hypothetical protein D3C73_1220330 [compost metagenome]